MINVNIFFLSFILLVITGCTSVGEVQKPYTPEDSDKFTYQIENSSIASKEAVSILKKRLESQLASNNILSENDNENTKDIKITFNHYRMRHGASRALVGVFAGADKIDTTITITQGDIHLGEFIVKSSNASAWGTSRGLIEAHADKIINYLKK